MCAEIAERDVARQGVLDQYRGRRREEYLSAVTNRRDARSAVHLVTHEASGLFGCFTGVNSHADADVFTVRPVEFTQRALNFGRARHTGSWGREGREKGVALGTLLVPTMVFEAQPNNSVVISEDPPVRGVSDPSQQGRRTFDIRGEEGQGFDD